MSRQLLLGSGQVPGSGNAIGRRLSITSLIGNVPRLMFCGRPGAGSGLLTSCKSVTGEAHRGAEGRGRDSYSDSVVPSEDEALSPP